MGPNPVTDVLTALPRPVDRRHVRQLKKGGVTLDYVPWFLIAKHLHHRVPGWCWEVRSVQEVGGSVVVHGTLLVPTSEGTLRYDAVASESLKGPSHAPPAEVAESACLRRAAAKSGLAIDLYDSTQ
jgi:hypothetical protein